MPRFVSPETVYVTPNFVAKLHDFVVESSAERRAAGGTAPEVLRSLALCLIEAILGECPPKSSKDDGLQALLRGEVGTDFSQLLMELLEESSCLELQHVLDRVERMSAMKIEPVVVPATFVDMGVELPPPLRIEAPVSDTIVKTKLTVAELEVPDTDVGGAEMPDTDIYDFDGTAPRNDAVLKLLPHRPEGRAEHPTDRALPAQDRVAFHLQRWWLPIAIGCVLQADRCNEASVTDA
ncbi:MAG: hypothetical protein AAF449_18595 [Myxococcota bacterium]